MELATAKQLSVQYAAKVPRGAVKIQFDGISFSAILTEACYLPGNKQFHKLEKRENKTPKVFALVFSGGETLTFTLEDIQEVRKTLDGAVIEMISGDCVEVRYER